MAIGNSWLACLFPAKNNAERWQIVLVDLKQLILQ